MRRPIPPRQPSNWWWQHPAYRSYMLREATAIPLFFYALCLLSGVLALGRGDAAFGAWLAFMASTPLQMLQGLALLAALWHAWTWFKLVPKILVIPTSRGTLPGHWLRLAHLVPALLCWVLLPLAAWWALGQMAGGAA